LEIRTTRKTSSTNSSRRETRKWVHAKADERAVDRGCWFDLAAADRRRSFYAKFIRHSKGEFAGRPFELLDWQWLSCLGPLYGWKRPDGTRRYRRFEWWVPKKNGKSTTAAAMVIDALIVDGEIGAHAFGAAKDREQAGIVFEEAKAMVEQSPELRNRLRVIETTKRIVYPETRSFYKVLSQEAHKSGHGINASFAIIDELHVVTREMYQTLRYAGAARRQPLFGSISTAGDDLTSLGRERYLYSKRVFTEEIEDDELLVYIAEADSDAQWKNRKQWQKANPSLGTTITLASFEADFREAEQASPAAQANFRQLRLNLWQESNFTWFDLDAWDACRIDIDFEQLVSQGFWAGLDLASKMDLTAFVKIFRQGDQYLLIPRFWCPEEADTRRQQKNLTLLQPWMAAGYIKATRGNVADYDQIEKDLLEDAEVYHLQGLAFDPWNATQVASHLQDQGLKLLEFPQTLRNYNEPMQEFEKLVLARKIRHDGNPVMRWMIKNVSVRKDSNGNVRPDKDKSKDKIDGVTAGLMGLSQALLAPDPSFAGIDFI